jgi:hypothetical protein
MTGAERVLTTALLPFASEPKLKQVDEKRFFGPTLKGIAALEMFKAKFRAFAYRGDLVHSHLSEGFDISILEVHPIFLLACVECNLIPSTFHLMPISPRYASGITSTLNIFQSTAFMPNSASTCSSFQSADALE